MYNEELKEEFIGWYTTNPETSKICRYTFNAIGKFEQKWDADICTRSKDEVMPALQAIAGIRKNTNSSKIFILKRYIKWCHYVKHIPDSKTDILEINDVTSDNIRQQMVSSPADLSAKLSRLFGNDEDIRGDIANIFKVFYWLAFSGMSEDDILSVTSDNIDLGNMIVKYCGKSYPIYQEALPSIIQCMTQTMFRFRHSRYESKPKDRADGNLLLRGYDTYNTKSMRVALSRATKKKSTDSNPIRLSYSRIYLSGLFYRAHQRAKEQEDEVNFEFEATQFVESKGYDDSGTMSLSERKRRIEKGYLEDYQQWKNAFEL